MKGCEDRCESEGVEGLPATSRPDESTNIIR